MSYGTILGEHRSGGIKIRSAGGIPKIDETYIFRVQAANKNVSRFNIVQIPGLPIVNQTVSSYGLTVCRSKTAERSEENPLFWEVTCEFSSEVEEGQGGQDEQTPPTEWTPVYETKFERRQVVVTRDQAGTAIANSAGQPFENGLTVSRFLPVWEFFQFEPATVSDETVIGRNEVVNSGSFRGRAAKTLLCTVVSSQIGFYYGQPLRFTRYRLVFDYMTWQHRRLDVGTVFLSGGNLNAYTDNDGNVILGGLNGSGAKVAAGSPPAIRAFDMYPSVSFSSFLRF
jgi:hypothetical protein